MQQNHNIGAPQSFKINVRLSRWKAAATKSDLWHGHNKG